MSHRRKAKDRRKAENGLYNISYKGNVSVTVPGSDINVLSDSTE